MTQPTNQTAKRSSHVKVLGFIALLVVVMSLVMLQQSGRQNSSDTVFAANKSVQWVEANPAKVSVNWNSGATPTPTPTSSSSAARAAGASYFTTEPATPNPTEP